MKTATIVGIILIVLGILGFVFQSVSFTDKDTIVDAGPLQVQTEEEKTIPIPSILSGLAIVGGVILVAVGAKKSN